MNPNHADEPRRAAPDFSGEVDGEQLSDTWALLGSSAGAPRASAVDVDAAWARLEARLDDGASRVASRPVRGSWRRVAASVALLLLGGAGVWNAVPASVEAGPGERSRVVLPGGTEVELNAGSSLRWARGFAWVPGLPRSERVVRLEGEAFFDVTRDGRPFRVETSDARVRVLGTRFNVRARPGEGTAVSVDEGSVEVRESGEGAVVLTAGQRVTTGRGGLQVVAGETEPVAAWRRGGFAVTDAALGAVVDELRRRWSVAIETSALSEATLRQRLTLYYSGPVELGAVLDDVATALGLRYREVAGGWELVPSP